MADDPLNHVLDGFHRFRRYAPRMLRLLDLRAAPVAFPLLEAVTALRTGSNDAAQTAFLRPSSKWLNRNRALVADAGQHGGNRAVLAIEFFAVLRMVPGRWRTGDVRLWTQCSVSCRAPPFQTRRP